MGVSRPTSRCTGFFKKQLILCGFWCVLFPCLVHTSSAAPPSPHARFRSQLSNMDCRTTKILGARGNKRTLGKILNSWLEMFTLAQKFYNLKSFNPTGICIPFSIVFFGVLFTSWGALHGMDNSKNITVLSQIKTFIWSCLLLSGDVKLNPGPPPTKHGAKKKEPTRARNKQSSNFSADYDLSDYEIIPDPPHAENVTSEAIPIQASQSGTVSDLTANTSNLSRSHNTELQSSKSEQSGIEISAESTRSARMSSLSSSAGLPKTDYFQHVKEKKPLLKVRCVSSELTKDDCLAIMMSKTLHTVSDRRLPDEEREQIKNKLEDAMERFLNQIKCKKIWSTDEGFYESDPPDLFQFYLLANQIMEYGGTCKACVLCGKSLLKPISSTIFPSSLVDSFQSIHGEIAGQMLGNFNFPLFCSACEKQARQHETQLRDLYLTIMDPYNSGKQIEIESPAWLLHSLSAIMYRGIFLTNFFGELDNFDQLVHTLASLRSFILSSCTQMDQVPDEIINLFGVYILPNSSFYIDTDVPSNCLSQHLHLPQPTTIVKANDGIFLYTQFDCFHCVLQYSGSKIPMLDLTSNCFAPDLLHQKSINIAPGDTVTCEFIMFNTSDQRKQSFPRILVKENLKRAMSHQMNSILISQDTPELLPELKTLEHSALLVSGLPFAYVSDTPTHQFKSIDDEEYRSKIRQRAQEESPFMESNIEQQRVQVAKDEQIQYLTKKYKELETFNNSEWQTAAGTHAQNVELMCKIKELESSNARLTEVNKQLQEENHVLQLQQQRMGTPSQLDLEGVYDPPLKQI